MYRLCDQELFFDEWISDQQSKQRRRCYPGHKDRVFISEVFRFEELGFELVAQDFYKVFAAISRSESSTSKPGTIDHLAFEEFEFSETGFSSAVAAAMIRAAKKGTAN